MPTSRSLAAALAGVFLLSMTVTAPAGATGLARVTVAGPACSITDPENNTGAMLVNNQLVNGTWTYATGVWCTLRVADMLFYEQLNFNGAKVDSKFKNFTGVPRREDAILSQHPCAVCNGTWTFIWGQIVKAQSGMIFTNPPPGCVTIQNGLYLECVQMKTVTL